MHRSRTIFSLLALPLALAARGRAAHAQSIATPDSSNDTAARPAEGVAASPPFADAAAPAAARGPVEPSRPLVVAPGGAEGATPGASAPDTHSAAWRYAHRSVSIFGSAGLEMSGSGWGSMLGTGVSVAPRFVLGNGVVLEFEARASASLGTGQAVTSAGVSTVTTTGLSAGGSVGVGYALPISGSVLFVPTAHASLSGNTSRMGEQVADGIGVSGWARLGLAVIVGPHMVLEPALDAGVATSRYGSAGTYIDSTTPFVSTRVSLGYLF